MDLARVVTPTSFWYAYAVDPGYARSAIVAFSSTGVIGSSLLANAELEQRLRNQAPLLDDVNDGRSMLHPPTGDQRCILVMERFESMGMAVGKEVFDTVLWSGLFLGIWTAQGRPWQLLSRHEVKLHLCGSRRAKDANVRQALIDRFGPSRSEAMGTKAKPGELYGIAGDRWAALALAMTWRDQFAS